MPVDAIRRYFEHSDAYRDVRNGKYEPEQGFWIASQSRNGWTIGADAMTAALPLLTTFDASAAWGCCDAGHPVPTGFEDALFGHLRQPYPLRTEAWRRYEGRRMRGGKGGREMKIKGSIRWY